MTSDWLSWAADLAWKASIVLVGATFVTQLLRRRAAADRHAVWLTAVVCVLLLPVFSFAFTSWTLRLPVLPVAESAATAEAALTTIPEPATTAETPSVAAVAPPMHRVESTQLTPEGSAPPRTSMLLFALWLAGSGAVLGHILMCHMRVRRFAAQLAPMQDAMLVERTRLLARSLGIRRPIQLLEGEADAMPLTFGVLRATLLLPSSAGEWSVARQDAVIRHELAHVRRLDPLTQLMAGVMCGLHWFNPLAWLAARRMCVEREHACDDAVLAGGSRATDYATELLDIARGMRLRRSAAIAAIAMARPSQLRARLNALLEDRRRSERVSPRLLVPVVAGAFALLTPLAGVTPLLAERAAERATEIQPAPHVTSERGVFAPPVEPVGPRYAAEPAPATIAPTLAGFSYDLADAGDAEDCLSGRNTSVNSNIDDNERHTITWSGRGCSGEIVVDGDVEFDADFRRITGLSRGGYVRLKVEERGSERRVGIQPSATGVTHEYSVNGTRRDFDSAAQSWLDETLLMLFRGIGFMADERAEAMLRRGGVQAVLREVELLNGDHVRAAYLGLLVEKGRLDEPSLRRVLDLAGSTIESDHYVTDIITRIAGNYTMTDAVRNAYIEALDDVESDHYKYTAFQTLLQQGRLSAAQISAVLRSSNTIASDHYRAALLTDMNAQYGMTPDIRAAYLEAAAAIESDHYKASVLSQLMTGGGLGAAELSRLAEAASTIASDHYRTEVLNTFVDAGALDDPTMQRAFIRAASGIESDHYLQVLLSQVQARPGVNAATLGLILQAAASIESDHYRSTLLTEVARRHRMEGDTRAQFVRLMNAIDSETYRSPVARALEEQTR